MLVPTTRLYLLFAALGILSLFLAIVTNTQTSIATTLGLNLLLLIIAIGDGWRDKSKRVMVTREHLHRLSVGRDNRVTLQVSNESQREITLKLVDSYPQVFPVDEAELNCCLAANQTQKLSYSIFPQKRGEFTWKQIYVRQKSPWGLVWQNWQVAATETATVYPDLIGLRSLSIRLTLEKTGTMRQARRLGRGTEFAELREYRQGDDPRTIDWKATARRGMPVLKILEPEREQTLIILLDRGRLMTAQVQGMTRFDWGVNAALSLALAGLHRGDRVGLGIFDRQVITWIPPERGEKHMSSLIESVADIQPVLLESDYTSMVSQLVSQQTRRALVVILTDWVDATASRELLNTMMRLAPRYLPFCVALKDPNLDLIAQSSVDTIEQAYRQAIALDLLSDRQLTTQILQKKGVLVLDAPVNRLSTELVNRYLQLKDNNRI